MAFAVAMEHAGPRVCSRIFGVRVMLDNDGWGDNQERHEASPQEDAGEEHVGPGDGFNQFGSAAMAFGRGGGGQSTGSSESESPAIW